MPLRIEPHADSQAYEAVRWYERKKSGLGQRFLETYHQSFESIESSPRSFPLVKSRSGREFRYCLLKPFAYRVGFEVRPNEVIVLAVAHLRRSSRFWIRELRGENE